MVLIRLDSAKQLLPVIDKRSQRRSGFFSTDSTLASLLPAPEGAIRASAFLLGS